MDTSATADNLNEPLLVASDENDNEEEFFDASSNLSSTNTNYTNNNLVATSSAISSSATSYYGKVSPLSTGLLFPSSHGVVDRLPSSSSTSTHTSIPCLLFADHDPLAAISHICLLEKEVDYQGGVLAPSTLQRLTPQLFSVVHTCQLLNEDAGVRIIKKINKQYTQENDTLKLPVLIHEGNIYQEGLGPLLNSNGTWWSTTLSLLLPEFIDECIGKKHLLRPNDATGLYNMKLFIQRHSHLPALFYKVLTNPSATQRNQLSSKLLELLKLVNKDLQQFNNGPYLCGKQCTLADIYIFPIIERIVVVLSTYRNFFIPPSLSNLINWYDVMSDRPAIQLATADRSIESQNVYCYEKISRRQYLIEVYECYVRNEIQKFNELTNERGSPGVNVYRRECVGDDIDTPLRDMSICEKKSVCEQSCTIC